MSRKNKLKKLERRRQRGGSRHRFDLQKAELSVPEGMKLISYEISFEPMNDCAAENRFLLTLDQDRLQKIHDLLYDDPASAIEPIRQMLNEHPDTPTLVQWLGSALNHTGRGQEADELIRQNYQNHPNYLFARLDYLTMLMHRGEIETVERILDRKMDLKLMYPERDKFHASEVIAFNAFMVQLFVRKGDLKQADIYWGILDNVAPESHATKTLEDVLANAWLIDSVKKMSKRLPGAGRIPFFR